MKSIWSTSTPRRALRFEKTRPALILQNDIANRHSPIAIVAAIPSTFGDPRYPTEVLVAQPEGGLSVDSVVLLNQIRSTDRRRLTKRRGVVRPATMDKVEQAMQISLGLLKL